MITVKTLRKLKGWNQAMLAEAAGLEQSTISKIENGWDGATLRTLNLVSEALDVPLYELLMDDLTNSEVRILEVFRSLPADRKRGWEDMARAVLTESETADQ